MTGPKETSPTKTNGMRAGVQYLAVLVVSAGLGFGLQQVVGSSPEHPEATIPQVQVDLLDAPSDDVVDANLTPSLVQWGTEAPYSGNGPPGIRLSVRTDSDVIGWTIMAWANETIPSPATLCAMPGVFYDRHDWVYEADGGSGTGRGAFVTVPSTVPARLTPDGDQCFLRVQSTGAWNVKVCVEGPPVGPYDEPGPPRGLYDAPDGRHYDAWDRCIAIVVRV